MGEDSVRTPTENTLRMIVHRVDEFEGMLSKEQVYREVNENHISKNAENNQVLNDRLNDIAVKLSKQPNERLRELNSFSDGIYKAIRKDRDAFDQILHNDRTSFNDFKEELPQAHNQIKREVKNEIHEHYGSNISTAKWLIGAGAGAISGLVILLFNVSLNALDDIQVNIKEVHKNVKSDIKDIETDIGNLEKIVLYGTGFKTAGHLQSASEEKEEQGVEVQ